ncbi:MAG TPA: thiamine diphosphokinase [Candidatus Eisenbacteria bacterium]|nr:thiamine diphosphokinase [Candidatus Eisenbacteria bacterium]
MPNAVILANGTPPSRATLKDALRRATLFVCADGGSDTARRYGEIPDAIVGDLDSISKESLAVFREITTIPNADTEHTDTEKAIDWVLARGSFDEILLLGASAGRLDHVLGHLSLLHRYRGRVRLVLEDDHARAWLAGPGEEWIDEPAGTVVSFFAVGAPAENVTTVHLRYPLSNRQIELGVQDSISNVVETSPASIRIGSGGLLVIVVRQEAASPS